VTGPAGAPAGLRFDEVHDAAGAPRAHWRRLERDLLGADRATLLRAQDRVRRLRRNQGTLPATAGAAALRALDPIPHLLSPAEAAALDAGLRQRARLLELLLADVYGPRRLVERGVLPAEVVYGHPAFLRPCAGVPVGRWLVALAVDLARPPGGDWRVRGDRAAVPRGLGAVLSARRVLAGLHPDLYRGLRVQRVEGFFDTLRSTLAGLGEGLAAGAGDAAPAGGVRTVILSPGPDAEVFPEHAYLARNLGYTLVSGPDLTVRRGRVAVRSVGGLEPADVVLRLVDDEWCDPLELRPDSAFGPPGLLESARRGRVAVANAVGTGFVEHPVLGAFLPALARALLGEELRLAPVPTWWCGDDAARAEVLGDLDRVVLRPLTADAHPGAAAGSRLFPRTMTAGARGRLEAAVEARPGSWAAEEYAEAGTAPVVDDGRLAAGRLVLRGFVVAAGDGWETLPGGLARVRLERPGGEVVVVRKDVWALAGGPQRLAGPVLTLPQVDLGASLPSRNAEALYWMGRHAEAAETAVRAAQTISAELDESPELATDGGGAWGTMWAGALGWGDEPPHHSVIRSLADLLEASLSARELLSTHTGRVLATLEDRLGALRAATAPAEIDEIAGSTLTHLMALVGLSAESMVRDPGYLMLDIGRRLERALLLVRMLQGTLVPIPDRDIAGLTHETLLACCESLVAYRRRYRSDIEVHALARLLITDPGNPRSLYFQADRLLADLRRLPGPPPDEALQPLGTVLERLLMSDLAGLLAPAGDRRPGLAAFLGALAGDLDQVASAVTLRYFAHVPVQPLDLLAPGAAEPPGP